MTTSYIEELFNPTHRHDMLAAARKTLPADVTLVGTGVSGSISVVTLATALELPFAIVRRPGDGSHSYSASNSVDGYVEGYLEHQRWVFVDDFVATGATLLRVLRAMKKQFPDSEYAGAWFTIGFEDRSKAWKLHEPSKIRTDQGHYFNPEAGEFRKCL